MTDDLYFFRSFLQEFNFTFGIRGRHIFELDSSCILYNLKIVQYLAEQGKADLNIQNLEGRTGMHLAAEKGSVNTSAPRHAQPFRQAQLARSIICIVMTGIPLARVPLADVFAILSCINLSHQAWAHPHLGKMIDDRDVCAQVDDLVGVIQCMHAIMN